MKLLVLVISSLSIVSIAYSRVSFIARLIMICAVVSLFRALYF